MTTAPLTLVQRQIIEAIEISLRNRGYPPSVREIGNVVGLASSSSVTHQLELLQARGYITRVPGRPQALAVTSTATTPDPDISVSWCDDGVTLLCRREACMTVKMTATGLARYWWQQELDASGEWLTPEDITAARDAHQRTHTDGPSSGS